MSKFHYSHEIEVSMVSMLWHHPEFIDYVHRELDLDLHFNDPSLKVVLEMISVVHWQGSVVNWTTVLQALREVDCVEHCGGLQGLNDIFTDNGHYPEGSGIYAEAIINDYIGLLREYGAARAQRSDEVPIRYAGGNGRITPNKAWRRDQDPTDIGNAYIRGHRYLIRGWFNDEGIDIKLYPQTR